MEFLQELFLNCFPGSLFDPKYSAGTPQPFYGENFSLTESNVFANIPSKNMFVTKSYLFCIFQNVKSHFEFSRYFKATWNSRIAMLKFTRIKKNLNFVATAALDFQLN